MPSCTEIVSLSSKCRRRERKSLLAFDFLGFFVVVVVVVVVGGGLRFVFINTFLAPIPVVCVCVLFFNCRLSIFVFASLRPIGRCVCVCVFVDVFFLFFFSSTILRSCGQ